MALGFSAYVSWGGSPTLPQCPLLACPWQGLGGHPLKGGGLGCQPGMSLSPRAEPRGLDPCPPSHPGPPVLGLLTWCKPSPGMWGWGGAAAGGGAAGNCQSLKITTLDSSAQGLWRVPVPLPWPQLTMVPISLPQSHLLPIPLSHCCWRSLLLSGSSE